MADYLITAIQKDSSSEITHCLVHEFDGKTAYMGVKKTKNQVIASIDSGDTFKTARWNYSQNYWITEAEVGTVTRAGSRYLRSHEDRRVNDNLDNLLPLANLGL